jgi:hypothetical protein
MLRRPTRDQFHPVIRVIREERRLVLANPRIEGLHQVRRGSAWGGEHAFCLAWHVTFRPDWFRNIWGKGGDSGFSGKHEVGTGLHRLRTRRSEPLTKNYESSTLDDAA